MDPDALLVSLSAGTAAVILDRLRELASFRALHEDAVAALERGVLEAGTTGRVDVRLPQLELRRFAEWLDAEIELLHRHGGPRELLGLARGPAAAPTPPSSESGETRRALDGGASAELVVGDAVELRDAPSDIAGTIVSVVRRDHVRVHWTTGAGYAGKTTMLSVRVLRKRNGG